MANVAEAEAPLLGLTLAGKYTLQEVVGIGAMGAVYRAAHLTLDKPVAVKVLHPSLAQHPSFVERFKREAFSASRLDHPNSLRVLDFGEDVERGLVYLVLDYIEGEDLLAVMQREWPFDDARIVNVISQTLAALSVAHDLGIVHRDLKPENILLLSDSDDEGRPVDLVKVCDFGIAKLAMRAVEEGRPFASHLTTEGLIIGTPDYMSPEQARGIDVDGRSDIYSIGCVLYHLLAGRTPFISESPLGIAIQHVSDPPVPPSEFRPTHPGLELVCLKALSKRPDDRYQSAREMRRALRVALGQTAALMPSIVPASPPIESAAGVGAAAVAGSSASAGQAGDGGVTGPRFSTSTAPTEVASLAQATPSSSSRRWQRGAVFAAIAGAIGVTIFVLGSPRSPAPSAAMLQMPAPAPTATSANPSSNPMGEGALANAPAAVDAPPAAVATSERPRSATSTGFSNPTAARLAPRPSEHSRRVYAPAPANNRRSQEPPPPADNASAASAGAGKSPADSARAALLPLASLPGTSTSVSPDSATAPSPATISLERVAPVPVGPSPVAPGVYDVSGAAVSVGAISTTSGISVASVRSAVAHLALTSCYRQALRAQPNTSRMQATLTLSIDITGRVVGASLSRDGNLPNLRSCIEAEARGSSVRDVDTGEGSATVTLTFAPQ